VGTAASGRRPGRNAGARRSSSCHPPFSWQRDYARRFAPGIEELRTAFGSVSFAVENMFPCADGRPIIRALLTRLRPDRGRLRRVHPGCLALLPPPTETCSRWPTRWVPRSPTSIWCDGTGEARDEHLVPGRGNQPCGALLSSLAGRGFTGAVAVEVSTRRASSRAERRADLAEALAFARTHLAKPSTVDA